jgi:hypothetical protein
MWETLVKAQIKGVDGDALLVVLGASTIGHAVL